MNGVVFVKFLDIMKPLYLDNAATTKVCPEVVKEMLPYFKEKYGNPSSLHALGENAKEAINKARTILAKEINAKPQEITFTSGGTESNNLAIQGLKRAFPGKRIVIISEIEHPSIQEPCNYLQARKYKIIKIPVNKEGIINLDTLEKEIKNNLQDILLVSIMHVNNILGTIQDIEKIGLLCKLNNLPFHTDTVQSFGKLNIDVKKFNIDLLSASGHKIGAQKGIGFLYIKEKANISPLMFGGGQERNLRSGTENVPGIMGMAKALEITKKINKNKILEIRNKLITELEKIGGMLNGSKSDRIYNNIHVSFPSADANSLVLFLSKKGIYVSAGSACDSKKEREDHVLKAIKLNQENINSSIRISLNEDIKENHIKTIIQEIIKALKILKIK